MGSVHLLNVSPGDCTVIRHPSGRVTMIDICDGNINVEVEKARVELAERLNLLRPRGNFQMCQAPTNPIEYAKSIGIDSIFRFILTHPDCDHMDGFDALMDRYNVCNFWDTGVRRDKPEFGERSAYREEDWERYVTVREGREQGLTSLKKWAGAYFSFANRSEDGAGGGDGLYILAPDSELVKEANEDGGDINDGSFVILYRSIGGRILLPGDAHDNTWDFVLQNYATDVARCSFMLAPHHGRDSDRSYDFLDTVRPWLTLIGCAPCEHIDYSQWQRRNLEYITSNQAGNVVLEVSGGRIDVYVENENFARAKRNPPLIKNSQGYNFIYGILPTAESAPTADAAHV